MDGTSEPIELLTENINNIVKKIAIAEKFEDFHITVTRGSAKGDNFLGVILRVKIHGSRNGGKEETLHLIVKTPPEFQAIRDKMPLNGYYCREAYAYTVLIPAMTKLQDESNVPEDHRFDVAKCYKASSEDLMEVLVFEDLNEKGYVMCDRLKSLDYDHLMLIIRNLANYHALSFAMKEKDPDVFSQFTEHVFQKEEFRTEGEFETGIKEIKDRVINIMDDPECAKRLSNFCVNLHQKLINFLDFDSQDHTYDVITHGDCWTNNFLFKYEEGKPVKMKLLDWQIIKYSSPITDLAYLIFTGTGEEFRAKYLEEVFDSYYSILSSRLAELDCDVNKCYPEEIYRRQIKEKLPSGLLWALIVVPITLGSRDEAIDLSDLIGGDEPGLARVKMSDNCIARLRGVVRDFVKYKMI